MHTLKIALFISLMTLFTACGGGGGGGNNVQNNPPPVGGGNPGNPPTGSSNWDQMIWDQDQCG